MNRSSTTTTRRDRSMRPVDQLTRGLGWFSLGLGVAEILAGDALARWLGMSGRGLLFRAYGARELLAGVATLSTDKMPALWVRVGGDALDIATLAAGLRADNPRRENVGIALAAVIGVTLLDLYCAQELSKGVRRLDQPIRDYSNRSGFARSPDEMRGAARDFEVPADMRDPPPSMASLSQASPA